MILADTNVLSTFAPLDALTLLWELFPDRPAGVTPAISVKATKRHGGVHKSVLLERAIRAVTAFL